MKENYRIMSPSQLRLEFLSNVDSSIRFIQGVNPFSIRLNEEVYYVYIKNLSPAQLSNNNPNIWRIQLPLKEEFDLIKKSDSIFVLLGYDAKNEVYTTWNPYWCKQRLNIGKSVSLYSRLSLQEKVHNSGEIERINLNNDGDVICIPKRLIGEYIKDIKKFYPEETPFVVIGSSIQKRMQQANDALKTFEAFKSGIERSKDFLDYKECILEDEEVFQPTKVPASDEMKYQVNEFGKLTNLDAYICEKLVEFMNEDYPDYDEMINIAYDYYPKEITEKMTYADWIDLFKNENWKKVHHSKTKSNKGALKKRSKTIRVTLPNGTVIQNKVVSDTYEKVIREYYPDLITELKIKHAGVNIVSREYDKKYCKYQREIGEGYLLMTNSSTIQKYKDLCVINQELELGLKIELIDI